MAQIVTSIACPVRYCKIHHTLYWIINYLLRQNCEKCIFHRILSLERLGVCEIMTIYMELPGIRKVWYGLCCYWAGKFICFVIRQSVWLHVTVEFGFFSPLTVRNWTKSDTAIIKKNEVSYPGSNPRLDCSVPFVLMIFGKQELVSSIYFPSHNRLNTSYSMCLVPPWLWRSWTSPF